MGGGPLLGGEGQSWVSRMRLLGVPARLALEPPSQEWPELGVWSPHGGEMTECSPPCTPSPVWAQELVGLRHPRVSAEAAQEPQGRVRGEGQQGGAGVDGWAY